MVQILALPGATPGTDQASGVGLSADGRYLYAGIRGANRVAIIELEPDGAIAVGSVESGGDWPRHLVVDGAFVHVANQRSSTVATSGSASEAPSRSSVSRSRCPLRPTFCPCSEWPEGPSSFAKLAGL